MAESAKDKLLEIIQENLPKPPEDNTITDKSTSKPNLANLFQEFSKWSKEKADAHMKKVKANSNKKKEKADRPSADIDASIARTLQEYINKEKLKGSKVKDQSEGDDIEAGVKHLLSQTGSLIKAASTGLLECVKVLVGAGVKISNNSLKRAAAEGWLDIVKYLLQAGCEHVQPLTIDESVVVGAGYAGHAECYRVLLEHYIHKQHQVPSNRTLHGWLYSLCDRGRNECIKVLLDVARATSVIDVEIVCAAMGSNNPDTLRLVLTQTTKKQEKKLRQKDILASLIHQICKFCENQIPMLSVLVVEYGFKPDWDETLVSAIHYQNDDKAELSDFVVHLVENREEFGFSLNPDVNPAEALFPLQRAVLNQSHAVVEYLLKNGARTDKYLYKYPEYVQLDGDEAFLVLPHAECLSLVICALVAGLDDMFTPDYGRNSLLCAVLILRYGSPVHSDLTTTLKYILNKFEIGFEEDNSGRITDASHYLNMPPFGRICLIVLRMLYFGLYKEKYYFRDSLLFVHEELAIEMPEEECSQESFDESFEEGYLYFSEPDCKKRWAEFFKPCSLMQLARDNIRRKLETMIPKKIEQLPVPTQLKSYLNLPELDSLVEEYDEAFSQAIIIRKKFYHPSTLGMYSWMD